MENKYSKIFTSEKIDFEKQKKYGGKNCYQKISFNKNKKSS
jgi:hypothetical protein